MFPFWLRGPLREENKEGNEGGGALTIDAIVAAMKPVVQEIVNTGINGYDKRQGKVLTALQDQLKALGTKPPEDGGEGEGKPPEGGDKNKPDAATVRLTKTVEELTKKLQTEADARKAAEGRASEEKRHSTIRNELSKHQYAKENGIDAAFKLLESEIKYGEDGTLTTPDDTPIGEYLTAKLTKEYDYLLAPKPAGGSGATPGARGGKGAINLEDIKPGMSAEQRAAAQAQIAEAIKG